MEKRTLFLVVCFCVGVAISVSVIWYVITICKEKQNKNIVDSASGNIMLLLVNYNYTLSFPRIGNVNFPMKIYNNKHLFQDFPVSRRNHLYFIAQWVTQTHYSPN